jgi:hypothetical protein
MNIELTKDDRFDICLALSARVREAQEAVDAVLNSPLPLNIKSDAAELAAKERDRLRDLLDRIARA